MRALVSRSWGRARNALLLLVWALLCAPVEARAGAESHLAPRRCAPCAYSPAARVWWETNSLTPMNTFDEYLDNYVMKLAGELAERLRADGERCSVRRKNYAVCVHVERDDAEQQGLWLRVSNMGRTLPQSVAVHGLWPLYEGRENSPYGSAPTVSVSYGREPAAAAKDILRRFMPLYLPAWEKALASTVSQRDRDARRDAIADELRRLPGVSLWRGQSKERMEVRWPGEDHEFLELTVYATGTVSIARGTLREDRMLELLRGVSQVSEPAEPYGADDDEPFKPCSLCGRDRSDTCVLVAGRIMEPWTMHGDDDAQPVCTGCGRGLLTAYRAPVEHREDLAAERKPLYGVRAKAQRYLDNDRRMTLERLEDLLVVLRRHHAAPEAAGMDRWQREREQERAHQALWNNREKVAMELRLRDAELVHDSIRCRIGRAECLFRADTLPELIKEYRRNTKQAA